MNVHGSHPAVQYLCHFVHSEVHRNALFVLLNSHKDRILRQILMEVMFYAKYSSS
nr:MAG TPA: hypothetical protein [Caudoviricetes sp.]